MKLLYTFLFVLWMMPVVLVAGPVDKIAELLKRGNAHEMANFFAPNIEVAVLDAEDINTRQKAETALTRFFNDHKPQSVSPLHSINSTPDFNFEVLLLTTSKGVFRVSYTLKKEANNWVIIELRIEVEKVK